jgi:S1-C subfamily serine protease
LALHSPRVGEDVYNVGSPYFLEFLISSGLISAIDLKVKGFMAHYFVSTAMINPGSSGGGAFNEAGELIGVNTMTIGGPFGWAGISLAVDLSTLKEFLR